MPHNSSIIAEVDLADTFDESRIVFEAETTIPSQVAEVKDIAESFVSAANFGMFARDPAVAAKTIEVVSLEGPGQQTIRYEWNTSGMQVGAYRILLNQLEVANELSGLLKRVRLISTPGRKRRLHRRDIQSMSFPGRAGTLPFRFDFEDDLSGKREPVIRFTFRSDISDEELLKLVPRFVCWDSLVVRGGYLADLADVDPELDVDTGLASQQTYLGAERAVEHLLYEFIGHEAAFDSLINMAHRIHHIFSPLESVEIE